jgi:xylono-1,5-lactonase
MPQLGEIKLFCQAQHPLAESIMWQAERNRLLWVDLLQPALHIHDFGTGKTRGCLLNLEPPIGSFVLTNDPSMIVLAHRNGLSFLNTDTLAMMPFCDPENGRGGIIYNDMKVDRFGRLWVGTSHMRETDPLGALWCVNANGMAKQADSGFPISNGPAFSPDGRTMYFNDSYHRQTLAYDINGNTPSAINRRVFASYGEEEGLPDGMITDHEGCLWCAMWGSGRIIRLSPRGEKLMTISIPAGHATTLCFAGERLSQIYITSARDGLLPEVLQRLPLSGSLFSMETVVNGIPEPRFDVTGAGWTTHKSA